MALITVPNFFNTTAPAAADFNNAAKAICNQIGGTYYDEAAAAYVSSPGNLDSTNIVASAGFVNQQKAEPWHLFSATIKQNRQATIGASPTYIYITPLESSIFGIQIIDELGTAFVSGGNLVIFLNGFQTLITPPSVTGKNAGDAAYFSLNMPLSANDAVQINLDSLTVSANPINWSIMLEMKSLQVK